MLPADLLTQASGLSQTSRQVAAQGSPSVAAGPDSNADEQPAAAPAAQEVASADETPVQGQADKARPAQQAATTQPSVRPANWAGLLKSPKHTQRGRSRDLRPGSAAFRNKAAALDSGPDLASAMGFSLDTPTPSQLSITESQGPFGNAPSQGASQSPSEAELQSSSSSPGGSTAFQPVLLQAPNPPVGKDASWGSSSDSAVGVSQEAESQMAQQLQANASIWGTGLSTGGLTGIAPVLQMPHQQQQLQARLPQQAGRSYDSSASKGSVPLGTPWDSAPPASQASTTPTQPAKKPAPSVVKSTLVPNAVPFVPQSRQMGSNFVSQQAQQARFPHSQAQQQARASVPLTQQMPQQSNSVTSTLNGSSSVFLPGNLYSLQQQPQSTAQVPYLNGSALSGFNSMLMTQQSHGLHTSSAASPLDSGLQQLQRPCPPSTARQQQQLSDIWQQPALGLQQNGGSQASGFFTPKHQQAPAAHGKTPAGRNVASSYGT